MVSMFIFKYRKQKLLEKQQNVNFKRKTKHLAQYMTQRWLKKEERDPLILAAGNLVYWRIISDKKLIILEEVKIRGWVVNMQTITLILIGKSTKNGYYASVLTSVTVKMMREKFKLK